ATTSPAGSLVDPRSDHPILHKDVAVGGLRRPDADSFAVFQDDHVEHDAVVGRQDLPQRQLVGRNALGIDDTIDQAIVIRREIIEDPGHAHGGERKQRVLVHGTGGPGAFNRPASQQVEIPERPRGGLGIGEADISDADQEQRLSQTEVELSHNAHSSICVMVTWKPVPSIMTALGLPGYPVPARSTIAPYPIAERCESSGRSETEADAE